MKISNREKNNFGAKISGDYKTIIKIAKEAGITNSEIVQKIKSVHELLPTKEYSVWMTKPIQKTDYATGYAKPYGDIIISKNNGIRKGSKFSPNTDDTKSILDSYIHIIKTLGQKDFNNGSIKHIEWFKF